MEDKISNYEEIATPSQCEETLSIDKKQDELSEILNTEIIVEKLDQVLSSISNLQNCFDEKIETDNHKNALFDNMHKELTNHRNGIMEKNIETMALDIIQLTDSVQKYLRTYEKELPTEDNYLKLLKIVGGIAEDLRDILYRQSIEPYSVTGDEVDVRKQKIVQTVETNNASQNNKLAFRLSEGYEKNGKIIRPERIKIFKYKPDTINE